MIVRQRGDSDLASAAPPPTQYGADGLPILDAPPAKDGGEPPMLPKTNVEPAVLPKDKLEPAALPVAASSVPAMLKTIRLSDRNPPMSVILDLSGPVQFEKRLESGPGFSSAVLLLKGVRPADALAKHLVFARSIFKDCEVSANSDGTTTVTLNTVPVSGVSIVALDAPPRLLVTFTQSNHLADSGMNSGL